MERLADRTITKLAITIAVVAGALVWWGRAPVARVHPYKMVDELVTTDLSRWTGQDLKLHGWVVAGSIVDVWQHAPTTSFVLQKGGKRIRVIAATPSSWLLRPQMELVVEGRLAPASAVDVIDAQCADGLDSVAAERCRVPLDEHDYVFVATALNGRCPTKYDGCSASCQPVPSDVFR